MPDKTEIANFALIDIGANIISGFPADGDTSNEAEKVDIFWEVLRDEVLAKSNWDFAKEVVVLAVDSAYTIADSKWDYAYELPGDCVTPRYLSDSDCNFERRGSHILCNLEGGDAILTYTASIEDTTKWDAQFVVAFAKRLASQLARPIKKNEDLGDKLYQEYLVKIAEAQQTDAAQSNLSQEDKYKHTTDTDTWLTSRQI